MERFLLDWIKKNKERIEKMGVTIDEVVTSENRHIVPSVCVDFLNEKIS